MAILLSAALLGVLAGCPPEENHSPAESTVPAADVPACPPAEMPADPQVVDKIEVSLVDGSKARAELTGTALEGLTLTLNYQPADLDPELFEGEVADPAEWKVIATLTDANGDSVPCSQFGPGHACEFYSYDWMGWTTEGQLWGDASKVHWISPAPPERQVAGWQNRWGRIELPEEVGEYDLTIAIHPAPEIRRIIVGPLKPGDTIPIPEIGPGFVVYEAKVMVDVATESLVGRSNHTLSFVTPETRGVIMQELQRIGTQ